MSDQRVSNPYATPNTISGTAASPSALGVKPDARLAQAFLTQAFVWMFVGLIVSAGVAFIVQSNARLVGFAAENFFLLMIAQLALVMAISWGINRISATVALGLFFVYAASLGLTIGPHRGGLHPWLGGDGVPVGIRDVRCGGDLRPRDPALTGWAPRHPVHGAHRHPCRVHPEHLPRRVTASAGSSRSSVS